MSEKEKKAIKESDRLTIGKIIDTKEVEEASDIIHNKVILLNLIEKQSKSIEKLKTKNNDLLKKLRSRVKEVKKLQKYSLYKNEFSNLNKRIEKQEKIINEMIEALEEQYTYYEPCYLSVEKDKLICNKQESCKQCIKQYFEKKAEER